LRRRSRSLIAGCDATQNGQAKGKNLQNENRMTMYGHFPQLSSFYFDRQNSIALVPVDARGTPTPSRAIILLFT